jgi:hypothetical protein
LPNSWITYYNWLSQFFKIRNTIDSAFGIRCPASISSESAQVVKVYDYEGCVYDSKPVDENAFCGKVN